MDRGQQILRSNSVTKKTYAAIISKLFKRLDRVNNSLHEVELVEA